jgi:glycerophosphoryl diester phosphodiesterase
VGATELGDQQLAPKPSDKPVSTDRLIGADKPMGIFRAIGTAHRTTWRSPQIYVLVVGAMQLFLLLIATPMIRLLYRLVLVETGLGSIAYDRISHVLRNPLADLTLLLIAVVAVVAIMVELITLFVLASHHQDGDSTSFRLVLRQTWATIKKVASHPQGLLMIVYLILLLPLGHVGFATLLTKKVAVPPFVSEELSKSGTGSLLYGAFVLVVFYVNLRLIFTLPLLGTTSAGVWEAFVTSWRLTRRWRSLRIIGLLIVVAIPAVLAGTLLALLTLAPTIAADLIRPAAAPWTAAFGLSIWQIGIFVITALLTIMIVQSQTVIMRDWLQRLPEDHWHTPTVNTYSEPTHVTARRRKQLWGLAAGITVLAFAGTAVINYQTMIKLVDGEETEIIAHRGSVQGGVENTLPALRAAAKDGADRVEFDVMETKDGKFVVMHDSNLKRLSGKNLNVKDLTQDELTQITVRSGTMEAKIPSLEEWIQLSIQLNLPQLLEIKLHGGETPDLVPRLLAVLDKAGVTDWYTYHTLSQPIVDELKRVRPELVVGFIMPINFGGVPKVKADFLVIEQQSYSSRFIHQAWAAGFNVIVWTVNDEQQMRQYINAAADGIITDRSDLGVQARNDIADDKGLTGRLSDAIERSASI